MEWWCFEAIILLAGRLPEPEVAIDVVGICVNIGTWTFMFPFGLSGKRVRGVLLKFKISKVQLHDTTRGAWHCV